MMEVEIHPKQDKHVLSKQVEAARTHAYAFDGHDSTLASYCSAVRLSIYIYAV